MGIKEMLVDCGAVKFGRFVLTSGKESDYYIDIKKASTNPKILGAVAEEMAKHMEGEDRIAGMELGAVPVAVALSLRTGIPYLIVRKEKREHGTGKQVEGDLEKGERVVIVEDVTTTGGSVVNTVSLIRAEGGMVEKVLTVVDRDEGAKEKLEEVGVKLLPLVRRSDLF